MQRSKWGYIVAGGLCSGFFNGLFGSGGGVIAVLFLRKIVNDEKKAHATATLMILTLSIISLLYYKQYVEIPWKQGLMLVPGGLAGAFVGTAWLKNMENRQVRRLFGAVLAVSGAVMLF